MNKPQSIDRIKASVSERPSSVSKLIEGTKNGVLQWVPIGTHWLLDLSCKEDYESHWLVVEPGVRPTLRWLRGNAGDHKGSTILGGEEVTELVRVLEGSFPLSSMTDDQALRATLSFFSKLIPEVLTSR